MPPLRIDHQGSLILKHLNAKCQSSNVKLNLKSKCYESLVLNFEIHLTFACLREAASAKAGILKFGLIPLGFSLRFHPHSFYPLDSLNFPESLDHFVEVV
jgi:hypothetical protein